MSFFQNLSRNFSRGKSTRSDISKRIYAVIFIACSILMPVIVDLIMPFNATREAIIIDKVCELSYEKAAVIGLDMSREEADLDKLLDAILEIDLSDEQENLIQFSAPQTGIRNLDEIFSVILNKLYERAKAAGFEINIDDVSAEKNGSEIKRTIIRRLNEKLYANIFNKKYDNLDVTQEVLQAAYEKARGIIEDKVWKNARKTVSKDISAAQVIGTITDNIRNILDMNIGVYAIVSVIASIIGQIAAVVISLIGAQKSKICLYILMVGYVLGILFYIFFPLAGMNFSTLSTSFLTISLPGIATKHLLLDLLLRIIALISVYKFKRVKYDVYGTE